MLQRQSRRDRRFRQWRIDTRHMQYPHLQEGSNSAVVPRAQVNTGRVCGCTRRGANAPWRASGLLSYWMRPSEELQAIESSCHVPAHYRPATEDIRRSYVLIACECVRACVRVCVHVCGEGSENICKQRRTHVSSIRQSRGSSFSEWSNIIASLAQMRTCANT